MTLKFHDWNGGKANAEWQTVFVREPWCGEMQAQYWDAAQAFFPGYESFDQLDLDEWRIPNQEFIDRCTELNVDFVVGQIFKDCCVVWLANRADAPMVKLAFDMTDDDIF